MWMARRDGLIVTRSGRETIVYDEDTQEIHHLNHLASLVWQAADGHTSPDTLLSLARESIDPSVTTASIELTLSMLANANLVVGGSSVPAIRSRRRLMRGVALGAAILPAVVSVTAPLASASASTTCTGLPSNRYMDVRFRRNDAGDCNVVVFVANYCPNREYAVQLNRSLIGEPPLESWQSVVSTDNEGYGSVVVTSWANINAWLFSATVGGYSYGPVECIC